MASDFDVAGNEVAYRLAAAQPAEEGSASDPEELKQRRKLERADKRAEADIARRIG